MPITTNDGLAFPGSTGQMDPPTLYIFPENHDEVRVIKGPQSVTQGPGMVSGAVEYKRKPHYFPRPGMFINKGAANIMGLDHSKGQQLHEPGRQF